MTQTSSSSVTIAWNRFPGATGYKVSWRSGHGKGHRFWRGPEVLEGHGVSGWNGGWEFLRGPGGALEGSLTSPGAASILTSRPREIAVGFWGSHDG